MKQKEHDERLAVEIIKEHLKDEKNLQIKKDRHRTQDGEDPPDFYFEIGSDKIGCEVGHFDSIDQPTKGKGDNLLWQAGIRRKIVKRIEQSLQETGIPPFAWFMSFIQPPRESPQHAENVVNAITTMHQDSIEKSDIYKQTDFDKYYRLFIQKNIEYIDILYRDPLDETKKYCYFGGGIPTPTSKTIKPEEMQAVITCKNKDIPCWKVSCDRKWLIITNYETIGLFAITDAAKEKRYEHNFDKVLYIQPSWIEPKTRKQKPAGSLTENFTIYELKKLNQ